MQSKSSVQIGDIGCGTASMSECVSLPTVPHIGVLCIIALGCTCNYVSVCTASLLLMSDANYRDRYSFLNSDTAFVIDVADHWRRLGFVQLP